MVETVEVIGSGVIGGAIVKCLLGSKLVERVIATRRNLEKLMPLVKVKHFIDSTMSSI